jgi:hypothetical protein
MIVICDQKKRTRELDCLKDTALADHALKEKEIAISAGVQASAETLWIILIRNML